jgi:hypothetical protein
MRRPLPGLWLLVLIGLGVALGHPARGFATGTLLSLSVDPATLRQTSDKATSKAVTTVLLQDPAPAVFVCIVRSDQPAKIGFPTIVFRKGDRKATCEGKVQWKSVLRECRIRISAYNADAPDRRITFTVTLIPAEESIQPGDPQADRSN